MLINKILPKMNVITAAIIAIILLSIKFVTKVPNHFTIHLYLKIKFC